MIDLKPASSRMTDVLAGIADTQLTGPTPCTEYTVADLIGHVDQVALGLDKAPALDPEWRDTVAEHVRALSDHWSEPAAWQGTGALELPNEVWGDIVLTELVVHGWDLAKATGQPFDLLPDDTLRACFEHVAEFVPRAPVPTLWAPSVEVGPGATLLDRIVAITGRQP